MMLKVGTAALWMSSAVTMSLIMVDQAFAGFGSFTPPPPVPEINGPGALAVIALLVSIGVVLYNKVRK